MIEANHGHIVCMWSTLGLMGLKFTKFTLNFQTIKAFLPAMIEANHGHIVCMWSTLEL